MRKVFPGWGRRTSLRTTIFLASGLLVIFVVTLLGTAFLNFYRASAVDSARVYSSRLTELVGKNIAFMAESIQSYVASQASALQEPGTAASSFQAPWSITENSLIQQMTYSNLAIERVYFEDATGTPYFYDRLTGNDLAAAPALPGFIDSHLSEIRSWWGSPYWFVLKGSDRYVYLAMASFHSNIPVYAGVVAVGVPVSYFESHFDQYKMIGGGAFFVFNRIGSCIYATNDSLEPEARNAFLRARRNVGGTISFEGQSNSSLFALVRPAGQLLTFVSVIPKDSLGGNQRSIQRILVFVSGAASLLAFVLAWLISAGITRDLGKLSRSLKEVSEGDLERRVEIRRRDELGDLGQAFNRMTKRLKETINRLAEETAHKRQAELKAIEAEYRALQASINPHFLYNILESINSIAKLNHEERISQIVEALSSVLRRTMADGRSFIPLDSEIDYLRKYLALHEAITGGRVQSTFEIDQTAGRCMVPKLMLQPLVENSVKYGLVDLEREGRVSVAAYVNERLHIVVSDNGAGMTRAQVNRVYESGDESSVASSARRDHDGRLRGFGLRSVVRRLQFLYPGDFSFQIQSKRSAGTRIEITLPASCGDGE